MKMYCMVSSCDFEYEDNPTNAPLQFCPKCGGTAFGNQIVKCPHCGKRTGVAMMFHQPRQPFDLTDMKMQIFEVKL